MKGYMPTDYGLGDGFWRFTNGGGITRIQDMHLYTVAEGGRTCVIIETPETHPLIENEADSKELDSFLSKFKIKEVVIS